MKRLTLVFHLTTLVLAVKEVGLSTCEKKSMKGKKMILPVELNEDQDNE